MKRFALALILTGTLAASGRAQVIYQTSFPDWDNWTLELPSGKKPGWDVDRNPLTTPFGAFRSPPNSLNFNNRKDYQGSTIPAKTATSPPIDLTQATGIPVLTFWCNNQSEEGMCSPIHEGLQVYVRGNTTVKQCMNRSDGCCAIPPTCTLTGWHEHALVLDKSMGVVVVEFSFRHDSILLNNTAGWFIDDLEIRDHPAPLTYCSAKVNSQGCTPVISSSGAASATAWVTPDFLITATEVINNKNGIFFYGMSGQAAIPFQGGSLCFGPPRRRTPLSNSGGNSTPADCSGVFSFNLTSWIKSGSDPALAPGVVVNGQFWYRDAGASFSTGLTDAIEFSVLP